MATPTDAPPTYNEVTGKSLQVTSRIHSSLKQVIFRLRHGRVYEYNTDRSGENELPWIRSERENQLSSRLYQLPVELLLAITEGLSIVDRFALRRTCRRFAQVSPQPSKPFFSWPFPQQRRDMARLVWRDGACAACLAFRHHPDGRYVRRLYRLREMMWCSRCSLDHPRVFFSPGQVGKPDGERICVGIQGKVWLCAHDRYVTWDDIKRIEEEEEGKKKKKIGRSGRGEGVIECAKCYRRSAVGKILARLGKSDLVQPYTRLQITMPSEEVSLSRGTQGPVVVEVRSKILILQLDPNIPVTRTRLVESLKKIRDTSRLESILCPHLSDEQLLLPFGPATCRCFVDSPSNDEHNDNHHHHHESHRHHQHPEYCTKSRKFRDEWCCCYRRQNPPPHQDDTEPPGQFMPDISLTTWYGSERNRRGMQEHKGIYHAGYCPECQARFSWERRGRRIYLGVERDLPSIQSTTTTTTTGPLVKSWINKLDPQSWGINEDEELRHVAWCEDTECMTRAGWTRLYHLMHVDIDGFKGQQGEKLRDGFAWKSEYLPIPGYSGSPGNSNLG